MRSDNISFFEAVKAHRRGQQLLSTYLPHFFLLITLHSAVAAAKPYVTLWLLCQVARSLLLQQTDGVWLWLWITLGVQAALILAEGTLRRFKEAKWEQLYRTVDRIVVDKLLSLDHADVDDHRTQDLLSKVREHTSELGRGLAQVPNVLQNVLLGVFGMIGAVAVSCGILLSAVDASFVTTAIVLLLAGTLGGAWRLKTVFEQRRDDTTEEIVTLDRLYYTLYSTMFDERKAADVRLYRQDKAIERYLQKADEAFFKKRGLKRQHHAVLRGLPAALSTIWLLVVGVFAAIKTHAGILDASELVLLVGAATLFWKNADVLHEGVGQHRQNVPYLQTAFAFFDIPHRLYQGSLTTEKRRDCDYELEFRHVSFRYPSQTAYALKDVSVTFRAGSRTAIVGENGSGKSTLVKLMCRLYDPDEGEILLNGIDIRKYRYTDYMQTVAAVLQEFRLLAQPLADNVASGASYDTDRVKQCLKDASFDVNASPWNGNVQTILYEDVAVTIGDAQKIAIARALYKNAPFMILDEPTAALDPVTEAQIYESFDRIVGDKTAIYVSHRLSSCRFCDEILVFDRGRIVERGTHEDLLAKEDSRYRTLWYAQAQYYMT